MLEDDRGGDNQRADDKRCDVVEEEIADGKDEHREITLSESGLTMITRLNMAVMIAILRIMKLSGISASRTPYDVAIALPPLNLSMGVNA